MKRVDGDAGAQYSLLEAAAVIKGLKSHRMGLTNPEAQRRVRTQGPHVFFAAPARAQAWLSPRAAPALVSVAGGFCLGTYLSNVVLQIFFVLAAALYLYEQRTRRQRMLAPDVFADYVPAKARVRRSDRLERLPTAAVAVGDIVCLQTGDRVPADIRLIEAEHALFDTSLLFGDSAPVHAYTHALAGAAPLSARHNLAYAGTVLIQGTVTGIVYATGEKTLLSEVVRGANAAPTTQPEPSSPLQRMSVWMPALALLTAAILAAIGVLAGQPESTIALTAAAILVAGCMPLCTLASFTALAYARRLMRPLQATLQSGAHLEQLARMDMLLVNTAALGARNLQPARLLVGRSAYTLDKNALRTANGKKLPADDRRQLSLFFEAAALSYPPYQPLANHHEANALRTAAAFGSRTVSALQRAYPPLHTFAYDASRQRGSTATVYGDGHVLFVHGSLDGVLSASTKLWDHGHVRPLSDRDRTHFQQQAILAHAGGRHTVALAYRLLPKKTAHAELTAAAAEQELVFLGCVELEGALQQEMRTLLDALGHHRLKAVFLSPTPQPYAITVEQLSRLDDTPLLERLEKGTATFAGLGPTEVARLIRAAQKRGHSVGVLGAAASDLPALRQADVALAAGRSTVLREVADAHVTLSASLPAMVQAARRAVAGWRHAAALFITVQVAVLLVAGGSGLLLAASAIPPVLGIGQYVVLALVLAPLAWLPLRRAQLSSFTGMWRLLMHGLLLALAAGAAFACTFILSGISPVYFPLSSWFALHAATVALVTLVLCAHAFVLIAVPGWQHLRRRYVGILTASLALLILFVYTPPLQQWFNTARLSLTDWLITLFIVALYALAITVHERTYDLRMQVARALSSRSGARLA